MPVLEHAISAFFHYFVAYPAPKESTDPKDLKGAKPASSSSANHTNTAAATRLPLPRVRRNNSTSTTTTTSSNNIGAKRARMDAIKRRTRVFSLSFPNPPPLVAGPPVGPAGKETGESSEQNRASWIQTPHVAGPAPPSSSQPQRQRDVHLGPRHPPPSSSTSDAPQATSNSGKTRASKGTAPAGTTNTKGSGWTAWPQDVDVVGTTSAETLTKLIAAGHHHHNSSAAPFANTVKKGVKRKRSNSSVASTLSSSSSSLSKKLSGLMARTPKKARRTGTGGMEVLQEGRGTYRPQAQLHMQIKREDEVEVSSENARRDVHAALRQGGCRLVGSSVDPDDVYTDKPDDALLSISSVLRTLTGEGPPHHQPLPFLRTSRLAVESMTYCLWVACYKSLALFPYTNDKEEEEAVKEERECYAIQLFMAELGMAILERLPCEGVLHIPVDPRVSNNVVDMIHHTLYLVEAFTEVGAELHRLVFDIPATIAGIHAGQILSLEHDLHINFTLVCDLVQTAACLDARPYGVSVPTRLMKNVGDERVRAGAAGISSGMSGMSMTNGVGVMKGLIGVPFNPKVPPQSGASSAAAATPAPVEQDIRDHPAFETIRAMVRLVEHRAPEVLVSARDVDYRRFLYALAGVRAVSLTQDCLVPLRWHAYLTEAQGSTSSPTLFYTPTEAQLRRAEERARGVRYTSRHRPSPSGSLTHIHSGRGEEGEEEEAPWAVELRREVEHNAARNPKVQRRYVDREWIGGSGLSKAVRDLAFDGGLHAQNSRFKPSPSLAQQPPESFLASLGGAGKRSVLMVMEGALEEECKLMGKLHGVVAEYLEGKFGSVQRGGGKQSRETSREA